jgi:uncharacterized protein (DUF58 family)
MRREHGHRWQVALVGTLALVVLALLFASQTLLLAAVVPLVYVLYETLSTVPATVDLAVTREFEPATPAPGEPVEVTLVLANESQRLVPDLRLIDGVPETVAVDGGSPRTATVLPPGATTTLQYTVVARQGEHEFDDPSVRLRSLSAASQVTTTLDAEERTLVCATTTRDEPGARDATAATTGSGIEFHATRQYRRGDPMRRIDWRHVAKTGEFVTVQYRENEPTPTVIVVDARPIGRVCRAPGHPSAVALCADSARRIHARLDRAGVSAAVAVVGLDGGERDTKHASVRDGLAWVPDAAPAHRLSALFDEIYDTEATNGTADNGSVSGVSPDSEAVRSDWTGDLSTAIDGLDDSDAETMARLLHRLPAGARVVLCTPLLDSWPVALGRAVVGRGSPLVVSSPDVFGDTSGQRIARVHRTLRLRALDGLGQTVDWTPEQPPDRRLVRAWPQPRRQP